MFRHHLLITFRNFKRFKSTFFINLAGLSTGLACVILIYLWVNDEMHVDKYHEHDSRLYTAMLNHEESTGINTGPGVPGVLADALVSEVPEIEMAVEDTDSQWFGNSFSISDGEINQKFFGKFASGDFFKLFSYKLIDGNKAQVLQDKNSIAISESAAMKLFNTTESVVGKTVDWHLLHVSGTATISGIFKDVPVNSSNQFDFVLPIAIYKDILGKDSFHWGNYNEYTYVLLKEDADVKALNAKVGDFIKKKIEWSNVELFFAKYSDNYLQGHYENGVQTGGRIIYVRLFSIVALFILAIACINFMNLSTARASRRLKEVGVKKAIGARRFDLINQYMSESVILSVIALLVSILMVSVLLPDFNQITGKQLTLNYDDQLILGLAAISLLTGILAGSYPALYLSRFKPIAVLKGAGHSGKKGNGTGEMWARKGLVVFQFTLSIILIVSVLVVYKQIEFIQNTNIGFEKDNVIVFPSEGKATENIELTLNELEKIPGVKDASATAHSFVNSGSYTTGLDWEGKNPDSDVRFTNITGYFNLVETMGIQIKEGRSFSKDYANETEKLILNETAIEVMGLEDPIGKTVDLWGNDMEVIGIMKDFYAQSLHEKIPPTFMRLGSEFLPLVMVKIKAGTEAETLSQIESFYRAFNPGYPFDFKFLDQEFQAQYEAEKRVSQLSRYFAGIAILISCLGLFGLAAFTAERRLKEISIRKILGSSEWNIIYLLSNDFTKMVLTAIVIAIPVSYLIAQKWLESFATSIELEWWYFAVTSLLALLIAWFTVGLQTVKAAKVNPVQSLKSE
ncbi:MAG: transporter permease [Thalassobius sp.]|nr:transporter permease [Thalassovita sp.]